MTMFALIDANNFYVSCERVYWPALQGKPVVVLSNNDGCAISRSNEAKALGIAMGAPWFEIRGLEQSAGLVALSANYVLYGDLSNRVMTLAAELGVEQEIYSIDESFVSLDGIAGNQILRARQKRQQILQWTGIPCGVGIAPTKTLAKLANHIAKTAERKPGSYPTEHAQVCDLAILPEQDLEDLFAATDVGDVWGVGRKISEQLKDGGVNTVLDLVRMDAGTVRRRWSVVLERTVRELQGMQCIGLEHTPPAKKEIACTRSFGRTVTDLAPLLEAVSEFATRAAEKLRAQGSMAGQVLVFMHTSPFHKGPQINRSVVVPLRRPTDDTAALVHAAGAGLRRIYRPGFELAKAGVMLLDLAAAGVMQCELELEPEDGRDRSKLMAAIDTLNARFGRGTVHTAAAGVPSQPKEWAMRQERRTPRYTTHWDEVMVAKAN